MHVHVCIGSQVATYTLYSTYTDLDDCIVQYQGLYDRKCEELHGDETAGAIKYLLEKTCAISKLTCSVDNHLQVQTTCNCCQDLVSLENPQKFSKTLYTSLAITRYARKQSSRELFTTALFLLCTWHQKEKALVLHILQEHILSCVKHYNMVKIASCCINCTMLQP